MKQGFVLLLFMLLVGSLNAQNNSLREVVATVRPVFSESNITFLNNFADHLVKHNLDSLGAYMRRYAKGSSFGSGFAFTNASDSQTYILTNRHVVAQAQYVNVEFSLEDQSVKSFNNCKIISVDFDNDLALISLPQGVRLERSLVFASKNAEDGEDVFTAGYPGLADKASWQLGKGIISNSSVHLEELIPSKNAIIQHTAQVDPGSSGGPLLRRNPNAPRGFEVLGMNTWKVDDRENANFSIQVPVIKAFLEKSLKGENKKSKDNLQKQATEFLSFAKDGYKTILPYISYEYIAKISLVKFFNLYDEATPEIKKVVKSQFNEESPIEAVRVIIATVLADKLSKSDLSFDNIEGYTNDGAVTVNLKNGDNSVKSTWISDQGLWRISELASVSFEESKKLKLDKSFFYISTTLTKNYDMVHSGLSYWEALLTFADTYYALGLGINGGSLYKEYYEWDYDSNSDILVGTESTFGGIQLLGGVHYPLKYGSFRFVPFFRLHAGLDIPISDFDGGGLSYGYRFGVEVAYSITRDNFILAGLGYRKKSFISFDETWDPISSLSLSIGYTF